jgi:hypothetical protein
MSEEPQTRKSALLWWLIIPCSLLILYAVSLWPIVYCLTKINPIGNRPNSGSETFFRVMNVFYRPHFWIAEKNKFYYDYLMSAYNLESPQVHMASWETYKKAREEKARGTK